MQQTPEESWRECHLHARNLLGKEGYQALLDELEGKKPEKDQMSSDKGLAIYLDGISASLHGNPETAEKDREIRSWLRNNGFQIIEIAVNELDDRNAMIRHFKKLARYLSGKEFANKISSDSSWFDN